MISEFTVWLEAMRALALGNTLQAVLHVSIYLTACTLVLRPNYDLRAKSALFAVLNLIGVYALFFRGFAQDAPIYSRELFLEFFAYVFFCALHWLLVSALSRSGKGGLLYLACIAYPIIPLIIVKIETAWQLIGFSYMAFRMAQAALEVRRDPDLKIGLSAYVAFLFFPLTIPIGPISPFGYFKRGLGNGVAPSIVSIGRSLARIALGYVMFRYIATIVYQLSFAGMWSDGFRHGIGDLLIASFSTLLYLYFNFAGFTHIVIGAAGLIGIPVKENFDSPILSRSIKEFWNRWHITLSEFVRDLVYTPIAVALTRTFGPYYALAAAMFAGLMTFIVIGIWHGSTIGFLIFGVLHGIGFGTNLAFDAGVRRLNKKGALRRLLKTRMWAGASWLMTMTFVAFSMIFFEFSTFDRLLLAFRLFDLTW